MKTLVPILLLLTLLPAWTQAAAPDPEHEGNAYVGPTKAEIELLEVLETAPYGTDRPFAARIRNNSAFHLDRLALRCTVTDDKGHRLLKGIVFRSNPMLSLRIAIPPFKTPELGIPPGAEAEVGLYTEDHRWTRGHGNYRYDCEIHGVSGSE